VLRPGSWHSRAGSRRGLRGRGGSNAAGRGARAARRRSRRAGRGSARRARRRRRALERRVDRARRPAAHRARRLRPARSAGPSLRATASCSTPTRRRRDGCGRAAAAPPAWARRSAC
jgi:hypothetical protein